MAQAPTTTLAAVWQDVCQKAGGWIASTTTSGGSTTTLVDSALISTMRNTNSFYGWYVRLTSGDASGEIRRVASLTIGSGTVTVDRAFTATVATSVTYQLMTFHPDVMTRHLQEVLRNAYIMERVPLSLITNHDFENHTSSTPDSWSATNVTMTTATGVANVANGHRSLQITATAANGYASLTTAIDVVPGDPYRFEGKAKADGGNTADLILYDVTNSAVLQTLSTTDSHFNLLDVSGSFPSTCRQINVRCRMVQNLGVAYFDDIVLIQTRKVRVPLPSWVESDRDLRAIYQRVAVDMDEERDHLLSWGWETRGASGMGRGWELILNRPITYPLWAKIYRPYPTVSASTDTTTMNREWAMWAVLARMFGERGIAGAAGLAGSHRLDAAYAAQEASRLAALHTEQALRPIGAHR